MNSVVNQVYAYAVWLGIVALVIIVFRTASCCESVTASQSRIDSCECLEDGRTAVSVDAVDK